MPDPEVLLLEGVEHFNAARFYEAHEVWEDLWRMTEGEARLYYQGLIQSSVGLYHAQRGNRIGARNQLEKSLAKLRRYPASYGGLDNAALVRCLEAALNHVVSVVAEAAVAEATENVRIVRL